ncbi:MAG: hypothetical protein K9K88_00950 [Desulfobacterales bacterium]|nr:hypothetical protein [Desulfobacterales bacterium]
MTVYRNRFDFDIGTLVKSPCRDCPDRSDIPDCVETCKLIDHVQRVLATSISSTRTFSAFEDYALRFEGWHK